jgi:MFS family permease
VPLRQVASLRSYVNIAATTGRSLGGPIGGALADSIGWRWSFILQCPLLGLAALLAWFLVPHKARPENLKSGPSRLARIDFAGSTLLAGTITTLMVAVELAGQKLPWNHPIVLSLLGGSVALGGLFVITEEYWTYEPVFPLRLLLNRDVVAAYSVLGLQIAAQLGVSGPNRETEL